MKTIYLFCASGMSTSLMVTKMQAAAKEMERDYYIEAFPISEVAKMGPKADLILLGPQIRNNQADTIKKCPGIPVEVIDFRDYGTMNGKKVMKHVVSVLEENEQDH